MKGIDMQDLECGFEWWWHSFTGKDVETGEEKSFFISFYLCNRSIGQPKPVLSKRPSYLMIKAGTWGKDAAQIHRFYGWKRIEVEEADPYSISAGDCFLSDEATRGYISVSSDEAKSHKDWMCQSGTMAWSLVMNKKSSFRHNLGTKTTYRGEVIWNGRTFRISPQNCYGFSDRKHGKDFSATWLRLNSCNLIGEVSGKRLYNSVFSIGEDDHCTAFRHEGKVYEFNPKRFWSFCKSSYECFETTKTVVWHVEKRTLLHRLVADISCRKRDMLLVNYVSPEGEKRFKKLWCGGNGMGSVELYRGNTLIEKVKVRNAGCEYGTCD